MHDAMNRPTVSAPLDYDYEALGRSAYLLVEELYPLCRSITGQGVRDTLNILERFVPLTRTSVASGTKAFDWEVPREWTIRDAYIKDATGQRIVDFRASNLHVVGYSIPTHTRMKLADLRAHLHTIPERPDWIPYRTSYYHEAWGFCLTQRQLDSLVDGEYEVCIDSSLEPGQLTLAELYVPGVVKDEVLIYTHTCHPSLCNDNLSALSVTTLLAQRLLSSAPHHFSYRFVFGPATIGSIAWLQGNEAHTADIRHGLVLASLGDRGQLTYKRSRRGNADIDRVADYVVARHAGVFEDFSPYGYDERQFCSPGFNLPVGRLTRAPNGTYPEYHTSADNLDFISASALGESLRACEEILGIVDQNARFLNLSPKCEPRLGPRGLFRVTGGRSPSEFEHALLWVLNQSDGDADLLAIAIRSRLDFSVIASAAQALREAGLLQRVA
jgi:aminopeptidase-like protein